MTGHKNKRKPKTNENLPPGGNAKDFQRERHKLEIAGATTTTVLVEAPPGAPRAAGSWSTASSSYPPPLYPAPERRPIKTDRDGVRTAASMDWRAPPPHNGHGGTSPLAEAAAAMADAVAVGDGPLFPMDGARNGVADEAGGQGADGPPMYVECYADWRVVRQLVVIKAPNFRNKSFSLSTRITAFPLEPNATSITLNLGRNAKLPNEPVATVAAGDRAPGFDANRRVTVNNLDAVYERVNPFENMATSCTEKSMAELTRVRTARVEGHVGELRIEIPHSLLPLVRRRAALDFMVDVYVENASDGVQFNADFADDGKMERGAHAFTFRSGVMSSTSEWLPCMDSPDQLAAWFIQIHCPADLVVVASGELADTVISQDRTKKVYRYHQMVPTAATNIGWAIGHFTPHVHEQMEEVVNFSLPGMSTALQHTIAHAKLESIFEFFEELLSCRFPFPSYKQVFVDKLPSDFQAYSSFALLHVNLTYTRRILDAVQRTRIVLASAVAAQFFGAFISASDYANSWVVVALARFLASRYVEKTFGNAECLYHTRLALNEVCEYERTWGQMLLRPGTRTRTLWHSSPSNSLTCSPLYAKAVYKKAELVMRMLHTRLGKEQFFQVLHKVLSVADQMKTKSAEPTCWTYLVLSTEAFFRTVHSVTGHEIATFLEQWVYGGGHASFNINFTFNRKRNMVELDVKQEEAGRNGIMRLDYLQLVIYRGPLTIMVQELDGSFAHSVQIDSDYSRHELQCHSKGRRQKKKKVPLSCGVEVDIDLANMDPDSPVLWVRADPDMLLLREMNVRQPSYHWEYLLRYERDPIAQMTALEKIQTGPSASSSNILCETITNESFYYRVRCKAAFALSAVYNKMVDVTTGRPPLIAVHCELFGSKSASHIPRVNNFVATCEKLNQYFVMQTTPQAIGRMRTKYGTCVNEAFNCLQYLLLYNENSINRYVDDYYRASLVAALAYSFTTGDIPEGSNPGHISADLERKLRELNTAINNDATQSSHGHVVGIAALIGYHYAQKFGLLPYDSALFWSFTKPKLYSELRKAALWILIERLRTVRSHAVAAFDDFKRLLRMSLEDDHPEIRRYIAEKLAERPPFESAMSTESGGSNPLNVPAVAEHLWAVMTAPRTESSQRALFMDAWLTMYGWSIPPVLGGSSEGVVYDDRIPVPVLPPRREDRPPSPLRGWHSTDVQLEREGDAYVPNVDDVLAEEGVL